MFFSSSEIKQTAARLLARWIQYNKSGRNFDTEMCPMAPCRHRTNPFFSVLAHTATNTSFKGKGLPTFKLEKMPFRWEVHLVQFSEVELLCATTYLWILLFGTWMLFSIPKFQFWKFEKAFWMNVCWLFAWRPIVPLMSIYWLQLQHSKTCLWIGILDTRKM